MWHVSRLKSNLTPGWEAEFCCPLFQACFTSDHTQHHWWVMLGNNCIITGLHFSVNFGFWSLGAYVICTISVSSQTFWIIAVVICLINPESHLARKPLDLWGYDEFLTGIFHPLFLFIEIDSAYGEDCQPRYFSVLELRQTRVIWKNCLILSFTLWVLILSVKKKFTWLDLTGLLNRHGCISPLKFPFHDKSEMRSFGFHRCVLSNSLLQVHWNRNPVLFHQKPSQLFHQLLLQLLSPSDNRSTGLHLHLPVCQSLWSPWYASALCHHHWTVIAAAAGPHSVYVTSTPFVYNIILM